MLAATGGAAGGADQAAFLIDEGLLSAVGADLPFCFGAVGEIFFQGAFYTHFPCVDALRVEFKSANEFQNLIDRHAIAEDSGDQFGIVPVFGVELVGKTFNGGLVSALVDELEVVAFVAFVVDCLDNLAVGH